MTPTGAIPPARPGQDRVLAYRRGRMGVAAVPGSGKTWTLSRLAAELLNSGVIGNDQEVLVVTLTNSAVDNFISRVNDFLEQSRRRMLVPNYRVRTLHGLAHDIVRERPSLVGLDERFQIIDERAADDIRTDAAHAWLQANPGILDDLLDPELENSKADWVRKEKLPGLVQELSLSFIRTAKDLRLSPDALRDRLDKLGFSAPLLDMGAAIYHDYQRALAYRGAVDFDDLIRLALDALEQDEHLLEILQARWPYILEDEAQDSSRLQEQILSKLAGANGNWVRVGDPNQAIYETFTTADPRLLRDFIERPTTQKADLFISGRSNEAIIYLANRYVDWTMAEFPETGARNALQAPPYINPIPPGGVGENPPEAPESIQLITKRLAPQDEIAAVGDSVARWLAENQDKTVAILAPRNIRAFEMVDDLRQRGVEYHDGLLRSTSSTRTTAGILGNLLSFLSDPMSARKLATAFKIWRRFPIESINGDAANEKDLTGRGEKALRSLAQVEAYLWPGPDNDWLVSSGLENSDPGLFSLLEQFRPLAQSWQDAVLLPVDQIILTLAQDIFKEPTELALAHKLAVLLRLAGDINPTWRLPELTGELAVIARNERRFLGLSEDDTGFDPDRYAGRVVVATMHKAKGLEWDRVYLLSLNNYDFPSGAPFDQYLPEKWFLRGKLNLEAETLAQLKALTGEDVHAWPALGEPTRTARVDYIRERIRLLYVGMTRARRDLVVTWNSGRTGNQQPAVSFLALQNIWEERGHESAA